MLEAELRLRPPAALAEEVEPLQLAQRALDRPVPPGDGLEQRQPELPPQHRRRHERLVGARGEAVDAGEDDLLDGRWDLDVDRVVESPDLRLADERADVDEGPDDLLEEERVALGRLEDAALHLRGQGGPADEGAQELPSGVARERVERDLAGAVGKLACGRLLDPPGVMVALGAAGQHEEQGRHLRVDEEPLKELERGGVGPVQVLEGDRDGSVLGQAHDQGPEHLERPVLQRLRRKLLESVVRVGLERQAEHRAEVGVDLEDAVAEQPRDAPAKRHAHPELRLVRQDAEPGPKEIPERPVRHRLAVGDAPALDPQGPAVRRAGALHELAELGQQPALADPRLARHEQDPARARERRVDRRPRLGQLALATDESRLRRAGRAGAARPGANALEPVRGDGLGPALERELHRLAPVEQERDPAAGVRADEDGPGIRRGLQPGREVHGVPERPVLDAAAGADGPHDDGAGGDPHPDAEALDAEGLLDVPGVGDDLLGRLQGGAGGALGVVLVGLRSPEQGQDPVAGEILDRSPEGLDGADHAGDGVVHDELEVLGIEALGQRGRPDEVGEHRRHHLALLAHRRRLPLAHRAILPATAANGQRRRMWPHEP